MLREITSWAVVLLLVAGVCGFAWLTQHPDAAWLEAAEEWPLAGPLAERFRRAYLGPPPGERTAAAERDPAPVVVILDAPPPDEPIDLTGGGRVAGAARESVRGKARGALGKEQEERSLSPRGLPDLTAVGGSLDEVRIAERTLSTPHTRVPRVPEFALPPPPRPRPVEREWLLPGTVLRAAPAADAIEIERTSELASVPLLDRRGEWLRVRLRGRDGWADPATPTTEIGKPGFASFHGRYAARPRSDVLALVKSRLDLREPNGWLGPFPLYTDVEDGALLALLDGVAERLDEAYGARFGLGLPKRRARPQIALFAHEADFRAIAEATPGTSVTVHTRGFAPGGLAVFYVGDDPWHMVLSGIVHELTHTLNRHALGPSLPPWLEEGLAEDLGGVWIEDPDAPAPALTHPGEGGRHPWWPQEIVSALAVVEPDDLWAPNADLVTLDREGFFGPGRLRHYKQSQLFVRCLLDGGDLRLADGFRRFLSGAAGGLPPEPRSLMNRIGGDWSEVEHVCREHRRELTEEIARLLPEGVSVGGVKGTVPQRLVEAGLLAGER